MNNTYLLFKGLGNKFKVCLMVFELCDRERPLFDRRGGGAGGELRVGGYVKPAGKERVKTTTPPGVTVPKAGASPMGRGRLSIVSPELG